MVVCERARITSLPAAAEGFCVNMLDQCKEKKNVDWTAYVAIIGARNILFG